MPRGSKPGERRGGRQKGTPNKKTTAIQDKLDKHGCDPIEQMAKLAMECIAEGDRATATGLLKELAQYVVPKRKAIEVSGEEGAEPIRITWKL